MFVRYTGPVSWFTGPPSWGELERVLNGKPRRAGMPLADPPIDGGDSPAFSRKRGAYLPPDVQRAGSDVPYAELHAHSGYSFLDGASTPEELVEEAVRLDLRAVALTDHDGLYGVVRFAEAAKELHMRTVFGAELSLGGWSRAGGWSRTDEPDPPGPHLLVLARGAEGYRRLSRQLAAAHLAGGEKGKPRYDYDALTEAAGGHWHILTGCRKGHVRQALSDGGPEAAAKALADLVDRFGRNRVSIELTHHGHPLDGERNAALADLAARFGIGVVATTAAHFAEPSRGRLAMALGAIRARHSLDEAAGWLAPLGGSHLRSGAEMTRLFSHCPEVVTAAAELGEQCAFGLKELRGRMPRSSMSWKSLPGCSFRDTSWWFTTSPGSAGRMASCARAADRLPTRRSATHLVSPRWTRWPTSCCSSGSCRPNATDRPTSTSTSNPTCARTSSSTSTTATAATTPPRWPTSSRTAVAARFATWHGRWDSLRASRTPGASRSAGGTAWPTLPMSRTSPSR